MVKTLIASEVPVDKEITGHLGSIGIRLRSVGDRSCTVEHQKQVRVSTDTKVLFRWQGASYSIPVRVLRSRMGAMLAGGTGYHTTLELVELPDDVRVLIDRAIARHRRESEEPGRGAGEGIQA